jgi:UDP-GlcNAc:undecaprenyl-phosphate GlcNAc-1-phosphate transferase
MYSLMLLGVCAFVFALTLTPVVRNVARQFGLVDRPDASRKLHHLPIPRLGGVAVFISYLLAYGVLLVAGFAATHEVRRGYPMANRMLPAMLLVFILGIIDDIRPIRAWQKFAGQIAAAIMVYFAGVHVGGFGAYRLHDWWSLPATVFWLVLCTNAINLIDGVDGLAAGVCVFATITTMLAALLQNNIDLALAVAPLLGCLLGFLRYNFNPATIFLGDSGSLLVGFFLGCCSILWSQKSATILGMTAPLLALSIPLLDTLLAVVRRFMRNQPIFMADRGHIHHRLLDRGWTPRRVALVIYGFSALSAILALCLMNQNFQGAVIVIFCAATWIGVQHLGYVEFGVAGRMFMEGAFRRLLNTNIALRTFEESLRNAAQPDDCWQVIRTSAHEFGFQTVEMTLNGRHYSLAGTQGDRPGAAHAGAEGGDQSWRVRIPLSEADFIALTRPFGDHSGHNVIAPYAECVRRLMEPKLAAFQRSTPMATTVAESETASLLRFQAATAAGANYVSPPEPVTRS